MNWDKIMAFYYTFTLGSTRNASKKLDVSASWISRQISSLEKETGQELVFLSGKRLVMTKKGELFFNSLKHLISQYESALEQLKPTSHTKEGNFTLSLPSFLSNFGFFEDITPFIKDHPQLALSFKTLNEAPDLLLGESDIDIRPLTKREPTIDYRYLTTYDIGLYASRAYLQENGILERVNDFKHHHLISFSNDCLFPYVPINWQLTHIPQWKQLTIIESITNIFQAIESGLGIGPLSHTAAKISRVPLVPILPDLLTQSIDIYYMSSKAISENKLVNELYNHLRDCPEGPLKGRIRM